VLDECASDAAPPRPRLDHQVVEVRLRARQRSEEAQRDHPDHMRVLDLHGLMTMGGSADTGG
jgi:hypothetical protein